MDYLQNIVIQIELHSVEGIRNCFENDINPNQLYNGRPLIEELTSEYTRTSKFKDCAKIFVDYGLQFEDKALLAVLLDDSAALEKLIADNSKIVRNKYTLKCAYTPLYNVTLLHICAEFNHLSCAEILVKNGADINAKAGTDELGFGGQTPIFHTVNQNNNESKDVLKFLLENLADLSITLQGIIWGKGYEWETLIPSVNPISYAMMGLLPQFHRDEITIANIVSILLKHRYTIEYYPMNVPNKYLTK
jgi:ankyrin repeat protein